MVLMKKTDRDSQKKNVTALKRVKVAITSKSRRFQIFSGEEREVGGPQAEGAIFSRSK